MAVLILKVQRPQWNNVEMAAAIFGLDMAPDCPEDETTAVEISGSVEKLQQVLTHIGRGPQLITVVDQLPLAPEEIR